MELNAQTVLEMIESITLAIGSTDETLISSATADLLSVRCFVENVGAEIDELNEDVKKLNTRNTELIKANNACMRQLNMQREKEDNKTENEEKELNEELSSFFGI